MRRRLPLLRTVVFLTAALVAASVLLLGFVRVPRVVVAPGRLAEETTAPADTAETDAPASDAVPRRFLGVVPSEEGAGLRPGQTAAIRLESYPWMREGTLEGRVAFVDERSGGSALAVTLTVDPASAPGPLVSGLRGEARIATGETESLGRLLVSRLADTAP
jgi:hypothetical protein